MSDLWNQITLGRSGLRVSRLGLGSSFGLDADQVERAFERGINYFYWGSLRQPRFGAGIRRLAPRHRDAIVVVVQTYTRVAALMRRSVESALAELGIDSADLLLLGLWNRAPSERIRDAARDLVHRGRARQVLISAHHRAAFGSYIEDPFYGAIMVRYNAAHPGAEGDVFPLLTANRPGVVAYTATRWRALLDRRLVPAAEPVPTATDCYRFVLSNPHVDVCLAGPANGLELEQAMAALDRGPLLPDELLWMRRVGRAVREGARQSLKNRVMRTIDRLAGTPGR
jgi:aryl-alcohol dehydrogenase-like predicted oxidoreductase